jgi:hypothetical protein
MFQGEDGRQTKFFIQKDLDVEIVEKLQSHISVCVLIWDLSRFSTNFVSRSMVVGLKQRSQSRGLFWLTQGALRGGGS